MKYCSLQYCIPLHITSFSALVVYFDLLKQTWCRSLLFATAKLSPLRAFIWQILLNIKQEVLKAINVLAKRFMRNVLNTAME